MKRSVRKFITKKYMAADGGEVPDDQSDEADDEADEEPEAPAADDDAADEPSLDERTKTMQDYLGKQYDQAADATDVKAAQQGARNANTRADIGSALEGLARANSQAYGGKGVDEGFYKGLKQDARQDVVEARQNRQQSINGFLQKNAISRQVAQDMMARGTYDQKQKAGQYQLDRQDPNSSVSKAAQGAFGHLFAKELGGQDVSGLSADQLERMGKDFEAKSRIDEAKAIAQMRITAQGAALNRRQDNVDTARDDKKDATDLKDARGDLTALGKDYDNQTASTRQGLGVAQGKVNGADRIFSLTEVTPEDLQAARNNPQAAAALRAKMDQLTPQKRNEVVMSLMNQLSPGNPGLGQFEHLRAGNAEDTMANIQQFFGSHPEAANQGAFIMDNLQSVENERRTGADLLSKHHDQMRAKHPRAFAHPDTADQADAMEKAFRGAPAAVVTASAPPQSGQTKTAAPPTFEEIQAEIKRRAALKASTPSAGATGAP